MCALSPLNIKFAINEHLLILQNFCLKFDRKPYYFFSIVNAPHINQKNLFSQPAILFIQLDSTKQNLKL